MTLSFDQQDLEAIMKCQLAAAAKLKKATAEANGIGHSMWVTHGLICDPSNNAVTGAEHARHAAAHAVHLVSAELAARLKCAADLYGATDMWASEDIERESLT